MVARSGLSVVAVLLFVAGGSSLAGAVVPARPTTAASPATFSPRLPWFVLSAKAGGHVSKGNVAAASSQTVTDSPGNVFYAELPSDGVPLAPPAGSSYDAADLISATAATDGTNLTFSAGTVGMTEPFPGAPNADPNWVNDSYIAWAIDPTLGGTPTYTVYFHLNPDGSDDGTLTDTATNTTVSCNVALSFSSTSGYQAVVPSACLPGVTTFQWFAYSIYDTVPFAQDPTGSQGFGKALPDWRRSGQPIFAPPVTSPVAPSSLSGSGGLPPSYWLFASDGGAFTFGGAQFYGSEGGSHLNQPVVGGSATLDGQGYWMVASDGGIFTFGDARFYGSTGSMHLNAPIVGMIPLSAGAGYWLVASDGGVFTFGNAQFYGSEGGAHLNQPIVGGASTPDGLGYWLVARDGGVFSFGDAKFFGSEGGTHLNQPIVGMASDPNGGYWLVAADGGIFSFGGAPFLGSMGEVRLTRPVVGMASTADGLGYRLVASDGGIFDFGDARFFGSEGGTVLNQPVVGMTSVG